MLKSITPFFIVDDLAATIEFYQSKLGFGLLHKGGSDGTDEDYWAMVGRDQVMLFFKSITADIHPQPSSSRHEWVGWDAYVLTDDPDALYGEFVDRGVAMHRELADNSDGLRAFEVADNNGYVLCFGRQIDR